MCLGKVYQNKEANKPILENIAHLRFSGDGMEMETLFGERKVLTGKLLEIDFVKSRIIIEN